jgi:hypothetical protein
MTMRAPEIAICAAWHAGDISRSLTTVDGQRLEIVHRGSWSHGLGPDFQDAKILFNDRELRTGSIEIHLTSRGWTDHGHNLDHKYDSVILHAVGEHDGRETRRSDGRLVPTVEVGPVSRFPLPDFATWDWDRIGGEVCAWRSATERPDLLRAILWRLGDARFGDRTSRIEAQCSVSPSAQVLWLEILDGLGYSQNRAPMQALGEILSLSVCEDIVRSARQEPVATLAASILGIAGFFPLSPREAHLAGLSPDSVTRIESAWYAKEATLSDFVAAVTNWERIRVRPNNHPIGRIVTAASLVASTSRTGGLLASLSAMVQDSSDLVKGFRELTTSGLSPGIGTDRAIDMLASGVLPFMLAYAQMVGDSSLADAAADQWAKLPDSAGNHRAKRAARQVAGTATLGRIGARGSQGLIQLDTALCQPRRCYECPIARLELEVNAT